MRRLAVELSFTFSRLYLPPATTALGDQPPHPATCSPHRDHGLIRLLVEGNSPRCLKEKGNVWSIPDREPLVPCSPTTGRKLDDAWSLCNIGREPVYQSAAMQDPRDVFRSTPAGGRRSIVLAVMAGINHDSLKEQVPLSHNGIMPRQHRRLQISRHRGCDNIIVCYASFPLSFVSQRSLRLRAAYKSDLSLLLR